MHRTWISLGLLSAVLVMGLMVGPAPGQLNSNGQMDVTLDENVCQKFQVPTDGKGLLDYIQKRTFDVPDPKMVEDLANQLGDDDFHIREQAFVKLMQLGPGVTDALKQASNSDDPETKKRAMDLLKQIESEADPMLQCAVARLIALRKPKGACAVLLAYLPFISDEEVAEEIITTLASLAMQDGQADGALVNGLKEELSVKRRAAALALARAGAGKQLPQLRELFQDPDVHVRRDIALALVKSLKDSQAIPVLIDLMNQLPPDQLWEAENVLRVLAGDKAPAEWLGLDRVSRDKTKKAWLQWWDQNQKNLDFTRLEPRKQEPGQYLVIHQTNAPNPAGGFGTSGRRVASLDPQNKELWQFDIHGRTPVDVLIVAKDKLALIEYASRQVNLRKPSGHMLENKEFTFSENLISGQLLPNGNILVVSRHDVSEIDQDGKRLFEYKPPAEIYRACKPRDNLLVFISSNGTLYYVDTVSKQVIKNVLVGSPGTFYGGLDALPNGHVLVPLPAQSQVLEFNVSGDIVKRFPVPSPTTAVYLPNGNILVGSQHTNRVSEVNRQGKIIWSHNCNDKVFRVQYQ